MINFATVFVGFQQSETQTSLLNYIEGLERTSDSLNEGLPIKMTREKFQRK